MLKGALKKSHISKIDTKQNEDGSDSSVPLPHILDKINELGLRES